MFGVTMQLEVAMIEEVDFIPKVASPTTGNQLYFVADRIDFAISQFSCVNSLFAFLRSGAPTVHSHRFCLTLNKAHKTMSKVLQLTSLLIVFHYASMGQKSSQSSTERDERGKMTEALGFIVPDSLNSSDEIQGVDLLPYLKVLNDSSEYQDIRSVTAHDSLFVPFDKTTLDPTRSYWCRITLSRPTRGNSNYYLRFRPWRKVAVYQPKAGSMYEIGKIGPFLRPFEKKIRYDLNALIPITISEEPIILYLQVNPHLRQLPLNYVGLFPSKPIDDMMAFRTIKNIIFASIGFCMLLYNFFLFLFNRERIYIYYMLMVFFLTTFLTSVYFFSYLFTFYSFPRWMLISMNLATLFLMLFVDQYLKLGKKGKRIHNLLLVIASGSGLLALPFVFSLLGVFEINTLTWEIASISWTMLAVAAILIVSIDALKKGFQPAKYFIMANTVFVMTSFLALMIELMGAKLQVWDYNWFTYRELVFTLGGVGMLSQVILYGIAIGYKMLLLNQEKSQAIEEKLKTQETLNLQLEEKVSQRTAELLKRNKENEILLGEIHHRVKNNLQVISSLLKLQSRQLDDDKARSAVLEGRDRVKSMALVHQRLYQQDQFSSIEMHDYLRNLVENLADSYGYGDKDFQFELNVPKLHLGVDSAVPLGLIVNELVSNVFKHAFTKARNNELGISMKHKEDKLHLEVTDNGEGFKTAPAEKKNSFGLELIEALTQELEGKIDFQNGVGTKVSLLVRSFQMVNV